MATVPSVVTQVKSNGAITGYIVTWANMQNGDQGEPYAAPGWADRNVQVLGTPGVGFHAKMEGSNSGFPSDGVTASVYPQSTDWSLLTSSGLAIDIVSVGANAMAEIDQIPLWVRPNIVGDGTTSVTVRMMVRKTG